MLQLRSTGTEFDLINYDVGKLFVAPESCETSVDGAKIGDLYVEYDVEFYLPKFSDSDETGTSCIYYSNDTLDGFDPGTTSTAMFPFGSALSGTKYFDIVANEFNVGVMFKPVIPGTYVMFLRCTSVEDLTLTSYHPWQLYGNCSHLLPGDIEYNYFDGSDTKAAVGWTILHFPDMESYFSVQGGDYLLTGNISEATLFVSPWNPTIDAIPNLSRFVDRSLDAKIVAAIRRLRLGGEAFGDSPKRLATHPEERAVVDRVCATDDCSSVGSTRSRKTR